MEPLKPGNLSVEWMYRLDLFIGLAVSRCSGVPFLHWPPSRHLRMSRAFLCHVMEYNKDQVIDAAIPIEVHDRGIYFLICGDEIVYIGKSINCRARVAFHESEGVKDFDSYAIFVVDNIDELGKYEAANIMHHKPKYNMALPGESIYKTALSIRKMYGHTAYMLKKMCKNGELESKVFNGIVYYNSSQLI